MIFYWLMLLLRRVAWLFRPPTPQQVAFVDPNKVCPACGHRLGVIRCVHEAVNGHPQVLVEHTCSVCGARRFEAPVVKISPEQVWPALPRTELEKLGDQRRLITRRAS